ncbi:MAG: enolase [Nitrosopumilaceae archaeon]|nr:enolase [Nitrosopumilaceae archaeon]NIU00501.1 enolase [Nitrosopumilaceae archaeon]NIU86884.1 enolase [Nitrosopumilaceae archaeon]NIV65564.1 enolase [Nitrosopumilaceae archaeon]NIX61103.1 enolase [Nitrosopumilaceae archaeon]
MPKITSVEGRILYNSRGNKTIEVDIESDNQFLGRVCAPSGASVGKHEAVGFPQGGPEKSLQILNENSSKFLNQDSDDLQSIHEILREIDQSENYSAVGGSLAFAITIAAIDSAAKSLNKPLFELLSPKSKLEYPFPLGNILGGGAHAGPGTPDIQEILVCATDAKNIREAIETNFAVHKELKKILQTEDPSFTNGRGDEGGWAPKVDNDKALELSAKACENLGFTLGKDISLGVDFASSTQWDENKSIYAYDRAGFTNTEEEQIEFVSNIIKKYKLIYAEDPVHEEAFKEMVELTTRFPESYITGDDLTVTNKKILEKAISLKSCNAAILKVNQAGSLYDAMKFADEANQNNIRLITSHRSGESIDSQISHIGIATKSKMLKVGIVGGERIAKLNELIRISEHDLIRGMVEL